MNQPLQPALFPNVFYALYQVWQLSPAEIDALYAAGWYRQERNVATTVSRVVDRQWKPIVMIRVNIQGFEMKKRLKKRFKANLNLFEIKIRPFVPRNEMDELWFGFKSSVHQWKRVRPLSEHLLSGLPASSFNTYELGVYHEGNLVAFSIFDRGAKSIASLEAAYHVEYKKYGLGIFTMLLELDYCQQEGLDYYYPGFYPKDSPMFDYKLRPGNIEFFDKKDGQWKGWETFEEKNWVFIDVLTKLQDAQSRLKDRFKCTLKISNHYSYPNVETTLMDYNFSLELRKPEELLMNPSHKVIYDPIEERFLLYYVEKLPSYESNATLIQPFHPMVLGGQFDTANDLAEALS